MRRNIYQVIARIPSSVWQKVRLVPVLALAVISVLLIRMLRPVILIRFSGIGGRIGVVMPHAEAYLCERDLGIQNPKALDIFYYLTPVTNRQVKVMTDRVLRVSGFARWLSSINRRLPGGRKHRISQITLRLPDAKRNTYDLQERSRQHYSLTHHEKELGMEGLRTLGIPAESQFVCFVARDSSYLDALDPNQDWTYHNYRNCSVQTYLQAVEELSRRGFFAVRMGATVKEPLVTSNPKIIDYANTGRTDLLDVYLGANCRFFLSSGTGIDCVATVFRRPIACVNFVPIGLPHTWGPKDIFITKKFWSRGEHRLLTFREVFECGASEFFSSQQFEQLGIDVLDNTPEEIKAVALEMDDRIDGTWQTTEEDEELQHRAWSIFNPKDVHKPFLPRIGAHFLRENRALLDL